MKSWILLDSESTTDIFRESKYITNIKTVPTTLKFMTNGNLLTTNKQGYLKNYGNLWYHTKSISNILILSNVKKKNYIISDSKNGDIFIVINIRPGGCDMIFTANKDELYYNNMSNTKGLSIPITVEENKNHYTQQQYEHEKVAREIYQMVYHPPIKYYKKIIKMNTMQIFKVTTEDIDICEKIFGTNIYTLKGNTARTKPK